MVMIYSCQAWQARPPKQASQIAPIAAKYIVIHHTATKPSSKGSLEGGIKLAKAIQNYHMDTNGWDDSGHNFLVTISGLVFEGRHGSLEAIESGKSIVAAHSGHREANASPGIENEGIYSENPMPDEQWQGLIALCVLLCQKLTIAPENIKGHRDFKATECPGEALYRRLPLLIEEVSMHLEH